MLDKIVLSDKEYEYLTKGIAGGAGIGILVGLFIENVPLAFALGGVMGIIAAFIYSYYKKLKKTKTVKQWSRIV